MYLHSTISCTATAVENRKRGTCCPGPSLAHVSVPNSHIRIFIRRVAESRIFPSSPSQFLDALSSPAFNHFRFTALLSIGRIRWAS
jgi:hypothetical protein